MPTPEQASWPGLLSSLLGGRSLAAADTAWAMAQVMSGEATPAQVAAFAVALRAKGETAEEVAGLAGEMLAHAHRIQVAGPAVDTCGTGGDRAHTVNISTLAAIVVAATGATVVKHGNRAASSSCGSADLLEQLGVVVDLPPAAVERCVAQVGIGFCFAPVFHPALRHAAVARREIGVPTVFNLLGPLTNPAQPSAQIVGVADERVAPVIAGVLARRGTAALVVHGEDGLDELTLSGPSRVWLVAKGQVGESRLDPADVGLAAVDAGRLRGGDPVHNAEVSRRVLAGEGGPVREAVLFNAAAALVALDGPDVDRLPEQVRAGLAAAAAALDDGLAASTLDRWAAATRALSE